MIYHNGFGKGTVGAGSKDGQPVPGPTKALQTVVLVRLIAMLAFGMCFVFELQSALALKLLARG